MITIEPRNISRAIVKDIDSYTVNIDPHKYIGKPVAAIISLVTGNKPDLLSIVLEKNSYFIYGKLGYVSLTLK